MNEVDEGHWGDAEVLLATGECGRMGGKENVGGWGTRACGGHPHMAGVLYRESSSGGAPLTSVRSLSMELFSPFAWQFCSSPNWVWKVLLGVLKYLAMCLIVWFSPSNAFHCFSC